MSGRIVVGTSSWADPGFVEEWYPKGMPARDRLQWYAERFEGVEVNSTFYAVPERPTVARWVAVTPEGFSFDWKLHQYLSRHSARIESLPPALRDRARTNERGRVLLDPELLSAVLDETLAAAKPLIDNGRLSSFLLQLTPGFSPRGHRLEELDPILERLTEHRVAVELRHRGWVEGEQAERTFAHLSERGAAFVGVDAPREEHMTIMPPVDAVTDERLAYIRAHGRDAHGYTTGKTVAERFGWTYTDEQLGEMRERVLGLAEDALDVRVMFNNNRGADAPTAARRMRQLLGQDPGPPPEEPQLTLG
jgi:uncharacterized protein YecE (DUF72 family)